MTTARMAPSPGRLPPSRPVFEELTGAKVELDLVPITSLYSTLMLDLQRGAGPLRCGVDRGVFYGELIDGKFIRPIDDLAASGAFPRWSYDAMPPPVKPAPHLGRRRLRRAQRRRRPGALLPPRRARRPRWQASRSRQELGYELPVPPRTWQQVLDIARFFDGKDWDGGDAPPDDGIALHLKPGEQGHFHFQSLAAAFAITAGRAARSHTTTCSGSTRRR